MRRRSLSSIFLGLANIAETLFPLLRGVILARLLAPSQFGLAISITMVASVAELMSELGVGQLALRYGIGSELATLHTLAVIRGVGLGMAIAIAGPYIALLFGSSQPFWIYAIAGLASVFRGFLHLEVRASMQQYRYVPEAAATFAGQFVWTVASIGAAFILPDYRAMVIGLVASAFGSTAISHMTSSQRFRLGWNRAVVREAFDYGRPLMLNGVALSIGSMGDRFLIGARLSLESLANYTALASAAFLPRSAVTNFMISLYTPQFMNVTEATEKSMLADTWLISLALIGGIYGLCFEAAGHEAVLIAFGSKYHVAQSLISMAGLLACIRYMAAVTVPPGLAAGRTRLILTSTLLQASSLVVAAASLFVYSSLPVLIGSLIIGETSALALMLWRLMSFVPFSMNVISLAPLASIIPVVGTGIIFAYNGDLSLQSRCCVSFLAILLHLASMFALLRLIDVKPHALLDRLFPRFLKAA